MSKRQSIAIPGYTPANPIPAAARKGPLLITGGIEGLDPETGGIAEGVEAQANLTFSNLQRVLEAGGSGWADVVKMEFLISGPDVRKEINKHWLEIFPDPDDRPARHVRLSDTLPAGAVLQCTATAWAD